jgi:hypothetical protein
MFFLDTGENKMMSGHHLFNWGECKDSQQYGSAKKWR